MEASVPPHRRGRPSMSQPATTPVKHKSHSKGKELVYSLSRRASPARQPTPESGHNSSSPPGLGVSYSKNQPLSYGIASQTTASLLQDDGFDGYFSPGYVPPHLRLYSTVQPLPKHQETEVQTKIPSDSQLQNSAQITVAKETEGNTAEQMASVDSTRRGRATPPHLRSLKDKPRHKSRTCNKSKSRTRERRERGQSLSNVNSQVTREQVLTLKPETHSPTGQLYQVASPSDIFEFGKDQYFGHDNVDQTLQGSPYAVTVSNGNAEMRSERRSPVSAATATAHEQGTDSNVTISVEDVYNTHSHRSRSKSRHKDGLMHKHHYVTENPHEATDAEMKPRRPRAVSQSHSSSPVAKPVDVESPFSSDAINESEEDTSIPFSRPRRSSRSGLTTPQYEKQRHVDYNRHRLDQVSKGSVKNVDEQRISRSKGASHANGKDTAFLEKADNDNRADSASANSGYPPNSNKDRIAKFMKVVNSSRPAWGANLLNPFITGTEDTRPLRDEDWSGGFSYSPSAPGEKASRSQTTQEYPPKERGHNFRPVAQISQSDSSDVTPLGGENHIGTLRAHRIEGRIIDGSSETDSESETSDPDYNDPRRDERGENQKIDSVAVREISESPATKAMEPPDERHSTDLSKALMEGRINTTSKSLGKLVNRRPFPHELPAGTNGIQTKDKKHYVDRKADKKNWDPSKEPGVVPVVAQHSRTIIHVAQCPLPDGHVQPFIPNSITGAPEIDTQHKAERHVVHEKVPVSYADFGMRPRELSEVFHTRLTKLESTLRKSARGYRGRSTGRYFPDDPNYRADPFSSILRRAPKEQQTPTVNIKMEKRAVSFDALPSAHASATLISVLCDGAGTIEKIVMLPMENRAVATFVDPAEAQAFFDLMVRNHGKPVVKAILDGTIDFDFPLRLLDVFPPGARVKNGAKRGASRVLQLEGWSKDELQDALEILFAEQQTIDLTYHELTKLFAKHLQALLERSVEIDTSVGLDPKRGIVVARLVFTGIIGAIDSYNSIKQDLKSSRIEFAADVCHPDSVDLLQLDEEDLVQGHPVALHGLPRQPSTVPKKTTGVRASLFNVDDDDDYY